MSVAAAEALLRAAGALPDDAIDGRMVLVAPHEPTFWRQRGHLHRRLGNLRAAIHRRAQVLALAGSEATRHGVAQEIRVRRSRLNRARRQAKGSG
ncbi:MAG TPA: tetratricopeptide repeat protein [Alphaproteobacteria bacterium]